MSRALSFALCTFLLVILSSYALFAYDSGTRKEIHYYQRPGAGKDLTMKNPDYKFQSAAVDTYTIVYYDFEPNHWQGWTRVDNTAQVDTFFHADDFSNLGGVSHGMLTPINGSISMWCGTRPDSSNPYLCSWVNLPGYGNNWDQMLESDEFSFIGQVTISYKLKYYTEVNYDSVKVEYYEDGEWHELAAYTGVGNVQNSHTFSPSSSKTRLRFHVITDREVSDQDGQIDTDGAAIVDDILVFDDSVTICNETFEEWSRGEKNHSGSIWHATANEGYGRYSGLLSGMRDKDACNTNWSTHVIFFANSESASPEYPGLYETPYCKGAGGKEAPCQDEYILSPVINLNKYSTNRNEYQDANIPTEKLPDLNGYILGYTIYWDLPYHNLVFFYWDVRNVDESGCPGEWNRLECMKYRHSRVYYFDMEDISNLIDSDRIQVRLGVIDMCGEWYPFYGDCEYHTPAPWLDNVYIKRYETSRPQWVFNSYMHQYLFQDNFPETSDLESYVRADMAKDINNIGNPVCRPGDSVIVMCFSPNGVGIAENGGYPAIYLNTRVQYIGDPSNPKPDIAGPQLEGTYGRYVSDDGVWTIIQGEYGSKENTYIFDLNDSLLTRGYEVSYYFRAVDNAGKSSTLPAGANEGEYFEFTCLPTLASDILYVDDYHGEGTLDGLVQPYLDFAFRSVLPEDNQPDRYDVNAPSYNISSDLSTRALPEHIRNAYRVIVWDSGDLPEHTISDGRISSKYNECELLIDWLDNSAHDVGLLIMGNDVACELRYIGNTSYADELMNTWCGVEIQENSYFYTTGGLTAGGVTSPLVIGHSEGIFYHGGVPDSILIIGGCPLIENFDCLEKADSLAAYALSYPFFERYYYAAIQNSRTNSMGYTARSMWFGFSFMYTDGASPGTFNIRNHMIKHVFDFFGTQTNDQMTGEQTPIVYSLAQNFPNPFNPYTTIKFAMREKGHVSIKVYDLSGRLVRTIVDEELDAGHYSIKWDGRNDRGRMVSSGVYFYRMKTGSFERTRKMVLIR